MGRRRSEGSRSGLAALILRVALGGLLAGHGSQKTFGWFNGPGLEGTSAGSRTPRKHGRTAKRKPERIHM